MLQSINIRAIRRPAAALWLLAGVAACSSTPSTGPTGGTGPASVTVSSGDGQTAAPATALPIRPAVLVKDASGSPVSGVTVTFTVDSGGGSLSATAAVSGTNGVATAGVWTLGLAEGRNILRVSSGSLAPVRIAATAAIAATTLPPTTIGSGGGTFTVLDAGPLKGFSVSVPAGALPNGITLTVGYSSSAAVQHGAHNSIAGPMVSIASSVSGYSAMPITVHIPAVIPEGTVPAVMIYDPVSGVQEPIPTLTWDSTGVTAAFSQLGSATTLSTSRTGSVTRAALRAPTPFNMIVIITPTATLMADMTTAFLPGRDDWEFPAGFSMLDDSNSVTVGMAATAFWYFAARPNPAPLWNQYQQAAGVPRSNRLGIRWAAITDQSLLPTYFVFIKQWLVTIFGSGSSAAADNQFLTIRTLLAQAPVVPQPQLVVLWKHSLVNGNDYILPAIVYKAIGQALYIADPNYPGDLTRTVTFNSTGAMNTYTSADGVAYDFIFPVTLPSMVPVNTISAGYQQVVAGTIGDAEFAPYPYTFRTKFGPIGDTLWIADSMTNWFQCTNCLPTPSASAQLPSSTSPIAYSDQWAQSSPTGAWTQTAGGPFPSQLLVTTSTSVAPTVGTAGYVIYELAPNAAGVGEAGSAIRWRDWKTITYVRVKDTIQLSPRPNGVGVPTTFTQQVTGPMQSSLQYTWDFNDGSALVTVTNNPATTHTYAAPGVYLITGQVLDPVTHQPLAPTAHLLDTVKVISYAWKFTSAGTAAVSLPAGGIGSTPGDTLARDSVTAILAHLSAAPADHRIFVLDSLNCHQIYLERFAAGQGNDASLVLNAIVLLLGTEQTATCAPANYNSSVTVGTLGAGPLNGSLTPKNPAVDASFSGTSITATMSGTTLTGSFVWLVYYTGGVGSYTVQFQATQVLPIP
jgi:PKD domain